MKLQSAVNSGIVPALAWLPVNMTSPEAVVMLVAIGIQESNFFDRRQTNGPARGFWQFEEAGVKGVLNHRSSASHAKRLCEVRQVAPDARSVHKRLEFDDVLAAGFARLLLWTDPQALPKVDKRDDAWRLYLRTWRPGRPRPEHWGRSHLMANIILDKFWR